MQTDQEYLEHLHSKSAREHQARVLELAAGSDQPEGEVAEQEIPPEDQAVADAEAGVKEAQAAHIEALQKQDEARRERAKKLHDEAVAKEAEERERSKAEPEVFKDHAPEQENADGIDFSKPLPDPMLKGGNPPRQATTADAEKSAAQMRREMKDPEWMQNARNASKKPLTQKQLAEDQDDYDPA